MPPKAKAAGKGRGPAKRKLAEEFPPGEVLTDTGKKSWKLGAPIGQGGFGLLYLADDSSANVVGPDAPYVVKVEPSDNGPLFCELKFYMLAAKPELIVSWMKSHKMKYLGVPKYWGSGLHERGGKRYRFMVMERFGTDLQKKFEEGGKRFPRKLVLQLGLRLLNILEYIHEHEYVHADIKASNLLLSHSNPNQVYLVDYGLAYRYSPQGTLKEYKEDPKRCHDGTIEFTSIDSHKGVSPCRRGDLEILGYCMVQWLCGRLPWEDKLQDPVYVRDSKIRCRENLSEFMSQCFSPQDRPEELQKYMEEVKSLGFADKPPYDKLRSLLQSGLQSIGATDDDKLEFSAPLNGAGPSSSGKKAVKRKKAAEEEEEAAGDTDEAPAKKKTAAKKKTTAKQKEVNGVSPKKRGAGAKKPTALKKTTPAKVTTPKKTTAPTKAVEPAAGHVEMATQTTPGLVVKRARGRPRKSN